MDVHAAHPWSVQDRLRQDQAISRDHRQIRIQVGETRLLVCVREGYAACALPCQAVPPAHGPRSCDPPCRVPQAAAAGNRPPRSHARPRPAHRAPARRSRDAHEDDPHRGALWRTRRNLPTSTPAMASEEIEALRRRAGTAARARAPFGASRGAAPDEEAPDRAGAAPARAAARVASGFRPARPAATSTRPTLAVSAATRAATRQWLCVVEEVADLWALDRSRLFPGRYHVLGGRLSALEGVRPEDLAIDRLVARVSAGGIDEVVLAMNATLEGQTTAHYLAERLEKLPDPAHPARPRPAGGRGARLSRRGDACAGSQGARTRLLEATGWKD